MCLSAGACRPTRCGGNVTRPRSRCRNNETIKRDDDEPARHADHCRERWKHEHIPADIPAEHGISDMKRRVVQKLEYLHPVTCRRQPEDQREDNPHRFDDSRQRVRDVYRRKLRTYTP